MRYLLTGGAGFIGSNIARGCLSRGIEVRILDNFSTGHRSNVEDLRDRLEIVEGDLRSYHIVKSAMEGVDVVLHQGALPSVPRSIADPLTTNEVNVQGTLNVLHSALDQGVGRVVYASSSSIYGDAPQEVKSESLPVRPMSPYAVSKLAGEKYCQVFYRIYGLQTVALRYFNVFGPYQDPDSPYSAVVPLFVRACAEGRRPTIHGDGEQSRDFTYVENVVHGNLLAAESDKAVGQVMNLACGGRVSINRLAAEVARLTGREDLESVHGPPRAGDVRHSLADVSKAEELLGYRPVVDFAEGLARTVEFFAD
ncbi:NAD-dependent epimerase/dehydratase family protein [Candidatus Fermentibacteria bacterium]|nr:NAD-dependent epimerase/dehydratase family protein [Candidatus Fermentibacteria bacterium]